jgi:hypothetical protein
VYSISLLATLNLRSRIQDALNEPISLEMPANLNIHQNISLRAGKEGLGLMHAVSPSASFAFANRVDISGGSGMSKYQPLEIDPHHSSDDNKHTKNLNAR